MYTKAQGCHLKGLPLSLRRLATPRHDTSLGDGGDGGDGLTICGILAKKAMSGKKSPSDRSPQLARCQSPPEDRVRRSFRSSSIPPTMNYSMDRSGHSPEGMELHKGSRSIPCLQLLSGCSSGDVLHDYYSVPLPSTLRHCRSSLISQQLTTGLAVFSGSLVRHCMRRSGGFLFPYHVFCIPLEILRSPGDRLK